MAITNIFGRDFYQGLAADAATCVPRVDGALFWATDTLTLYCYSGAAWNVVGGGGAILIDHDHSGDVGDGGTFDAANLTSGASGDGTVLTSDGLGGAAWEAVPATDVATDAIWDAAGDLAIGTGANTASKLAIGAAYNTLTVNSGATAPEWTGHIGARVYHNADQSIADTTLTPLAFTSERYDTNTFHDTVTKPNSMLTAPVSGYYLITGHIAFDANATGYRAIFILLGGATLIATMRITNNGVDSTLLSISAVYYLAATNYVELSAWQSSGGNLNVLSTGNYSPEFAIALLK